MKAKQPILKITMEDEYHKVSIEKKVVVDDTIAPWIDLVAGCLAGLGYQPHTINSIFSEEIYSVETKRGYNEKD